MKVSYNNKPMTSNSILENFTKGQNIIPKKEIFNIKNWKENFDVRRNESVQKNIEEIKNKKNDKIVKLFQITKSKFEENKNCKYSANFKYEFYNNINLNNYHLYIKEKETSVTLADFIYRK